MIGEMLSHYRVIAKLGSGGMGVVYEAEDIQLGRHVAIKVLPDELVSNRESLERLKREARAASALNHPNICVVHEIGDDKGRFFIVMELLQGQTLRQCIAGKAMTSTQVVQLGTQIADALEAAHLKRIIHRDIKPANVLVTERGQAKLLDFGLATRASNGLGETIGPTASVLEPLTQPGSVMGTLAYMSPEQARGASLDHRTDLYSLGAVLYEMATGTPPFAGVTAGQVLEGIFTQQPRPPANLNPAVLPDLERIIAKAMEKDREARYQSAAAIRTDLQRLHPQAPLSIADTAELPRASSVRRTRLALGFAILCLGAAAWYGGRLPRRDSMASVGARAGPSIAVLPFVDMSPAKDQEYFADGLAEELLNSLAKTPRLRVAARTSSFQFKGKTGDIGMIGQRLNVETILGGSVRRAGNRVRITAQLVKTSDGFHLWSEAYDRDLDDILAVQDDIARSVTSAMKVMLLDPNPSPAPLRSSNPDAYAFYLQGKYFAVQSSKAQLDRAVGYYEQALQLDPGFALAWVGLADARVAQASRGYIPVELGFDQARRAVERALGLNANLADAHAVMGAIRRSYDWDWAGADAVCKRALELEPGNARAIRTAARLARTLGRYDEAVELYRRALSIDPLNANAHYGFGGAATLAGKLADAEAAFRKALELNPALPGVHVGLGLIHLGRSEPTAALREMEQEADSAWRRQGLALAYVALGRKSDAEAALTRLVEKDKDEFAIQIAGVYAFRGEADEAFKWLERAYAQRDTGLADLKGYQLFKGIETDPRYRAFLTRMRLPM